MRSSRHLGVLVSALAATGLLLSACGGSSSSSSSSSAAAEATEAASAASSAAASGGADAGVAGKKVVLLTVSQSCDYCATHTDAFNELAQAAGIEVTQVINEFDKTVQATQVEQAIAQKPDAIVLWPADATAIVPSLEKIKAAGIPVIVTNSMPETDDESLYTAYTGPNDYNNGVSAAEAMIQGFAAKGFGDEGNIVVVTGVPGTPPAIQRLKGIEETLATEAPGIKIVGTLNADWDTTKATTATANLLTQYGNDGIQGIYAQADNMLAGSIAAVKQAGQDPSTLSLVGSNCSIEGYTAIESGEQFGTVLQSPIADGEAAADALIKLLAGEDQEKFQYIPAEVITNENLSDCAAAVGK